MKFPRLLTEIAKFPDFSRFSRPKLNSLTFSDSPGFPENRYSAIGIIYRLPNINVDICLSELSMDQAYLESNTVILLGDININLLQLNSVDTKKFNRFLNNFDLCQIIKDPTRITSNMETLIDIICISKDINYSN